MSEFLKDEPPSEWWRKFAQEDALALTLRTVLAAAGPFGPIIGEFLTQFVPQQRTDRLQDFVIQLNERLAGLEEQFIQRKESSPGYAALVEQATVAAVQTPSDARRRELANILASGLQWEDAELIQHETLVRLLEQLNEPQVIVLMSYGNFRRHEGDVLYQAFLEQHPGVFAATELRAASFIEVDWVMQEFYKDQLVSLGLLKETEGMVRKKTRELTITELGRLLLNVIGRLDESWKPPPGEVKLGERGH